MIRCTFGKLAGLTPGENDASTFGENKGDDTPKPIFGDLKKDLTAPNERDNLELSALVSICRLLIVSPLDTPPAFVANCDLDLVLYLPPAAVSFVAYVFFNLCSPVDLDLLVLAPELNVGCRSSFNVNFSVIIQHPRIIATHTTVVRETKFNINAMKNARRPPIR